MATTAASGTAANRHTHQYHRQHDLDGNDDSSNSNNNNGGNDVIVEPSLYPHVQSANEVASVAEEVAAIKTHSAATPATDGASSTPNDTPPNTAGASIWQPWYVHVMMTNNDIVLLLFLVDAFACV
jgi:hypothetical protein